MADQSKIEWTDATWNPITGCSRVSRGCENCYAERLAATRLRWHPSRVGLTDEHGRWNGGVRFNEQWLDQPLRWRKPRRVFVVAHGDLFHENVPDEWIDRMFAVMALAPKHQFQVLTKRPERMREYLAAGETMHMRVERIMEQMAGDRARPLDHQTRWNIHSKLSAWQPLASWPLPNVWIGTSAEDQKTLTARYPHLRDTPAAVRWLSLEPLLGPIYTTRLQIPGDLDTNALTGKCGMWPNLKRPGVDWIVVGGESGPYFRWMVADWARAIRDQCAEAGTPFFMKQMSGKMPIPEDLMIREWPRAAHHG